jgi:hypothetical protein
MIIRSNEILEKCPMCKVEPREGYFDDEMNDSFDYIKCPVCGHMETGSAGEVRRKWNRWADKDSLECVIQKFVDLYNFDQKDVEKLLHIGTVSQKEA